jgi:hypothetical protein
MLGQAVALEAVGARREALAACDSLVQHYGRSAQEQVVAAVARATEFKQTLVGA